MTIAFVSGTNTSQFGANTFSTPAVDTTGCSLLIIAAAFLTSTPPAISDSKGNTWTALTVRGATSCSSRLYYAKNPTVGSGHTFTATGSGVFATLCVAGFSGVNTTAPFDQQNSAASAGTTSQATGSVTPSEDGELVVSGISSGNGGSPFSIDSGFTIAVQNDGTATSFDCGLAYFVQGTAAAINPTWTLSSTQVAATIGTFKSDGIGGFHSRYYYDRAA